jgi:hypothetical protein
MCIRNITIFACHPEHGGLSALEPFTICDVAKKNNPPFMMRPCVPQEIRYIEVDRDCPECIAARPKTPPGFIRGWYSERKKWGKKK